MRRVVVSVGAAALFLVLSAGSVASIAAEGEGQAVRLVGWVVDSYCGKSNATAVGKDCTLKCHKDGADLVFWSETDSKIYKLSDQKAALASVGSKVVVIGQTHGSDTISVEKFDQPGAGDNVKKG